MSLDWKENRRRDWRRAIQQMSGAVRVDLLGIIENHIKYVARIKQDVDHINFIYTELLLAEYPEEHTVPTD